MPKRKNQLPQMKPKVVGGRTYGILYIDGQTIYLGLYDEPESQRKCDRLIAQYLANNRSLPQQPSKDGATPEFTIVELVSEFRRWRLRNQGELDRLPYLKHRSDDGSELSAIKYAARVLLKLFEDLPVRQFGADELEIVRAEMIRLDWSRKYINRQIQRLQGIFILSVLSGLEW